MGLLNQKRTFYASFKKVSIEEVASFLEKKFEGKYKVVFKDKAGLAKQMISGGQKEANVVVEKNSYHRIRTILHYAPANQTESGKDEVYFHTGRAELKGFIGFLDNEAGLIGSAIIGMFYGKATEFYDDVFNALIEEYELEEREINTGVSALFKKNK